MLLVGLSKAKGHANKIVCVNNLKQIGAATYIYSADHDRMVDFLSWLYPKHSFNGNLTKGLLFNYIGNKKTYLCPNEIEKPLFQTNTVYFSHALKTNFVDHSYSMNCGNCHVKNFSQVASPANTVYFIERTNSFPNNEQSLVGYIYKSSYSHNKSANLLKMDGHIDIMNEQKFNKSQNKYTWHPNPQPVDPEKDNE